MCFKIFDKFLYKVCIQLILMFAETDHENAIDYYPRNSRAGHAFRPIF